METEIKIEDKSGDKDFFTIVPNYILNHSTATTQSLYLQMKRFAGETGMCFATERTLMQKLGIGKKAFDASLKYLLKREWVSFVGLSRGKTRPIKTYKINNIWALNSKYYNKISSESNVSFQEDTSPKSKDKFQKQHKISSESNVEEEPVLRRTIKKKKESIKEKGILSFWEYFLLKTNRKFKFTPDRKALIRKRLGEGWTLAELKQATDRFVQDDWAGRQSHLDLIYCIGKQRGGADNLEKWLHKPKSLKEMEMEIGI